MADNLPAKPTVRALWHRSQRDVRRWKVSAYWYGGVTVLTAGIGAAIAAVASKDSSSWGIFLAVFAGVTVGPVLMWIGSRVNKWRQPEERFVLESMVERPDSLNAHGIIKALQPEPLGDPWWQIEYPDGTQSEWCQRQAQRNASFQERTHRIAFDFPHRDQEGKFIIIFRGVIRRDDPPVPLGEFVRFRSQETGWHSHTSQRSPHVP